MCRCVARYAVTKLGLLGFVSAGWGGSVLDARHLFQLGTTDLGSGTAQTEGYTGWGAETDSVVVDFPRHGRNTKEGEQESQQVLAGTDAAICIDPDLKGNSNADHFIRRDGKVFAGIHLIIEVTGAVGLDDKERIHQAFLDCVDACGATLLHIHLHKFSPQGVSGVAVLAESHISVHTWPERGYAAFDVFMCGDSEPMRAVDVLRNAFSAGDVKVRELLRGDGLVGE